MAVQRGADHATPMMSTSLGHRFGLLRDTAGVPGASLHRLRHDVATFLVSRGEILQAQVRLGQGDASTTLREYAYALPLTDAEGRRPPRRTPRPGHHRYRRHHLAPVGDTTMTSPDAGAPGG